MQGAIIFVLGTGVCFITKLSVRFNADIKVSHYTVTLFYLLKPIRVMVPDKIHEYEAP